jgi:hypothetical protein
VSRKNPLVEKFSRAYAATQSSLLREAFSDSRDSILTALVGIEGMSLRSLDVTFST